MTLISSSVQAPQDSLLDILRCPACGGSLSVDTDSARCDSCSTEYSPETAGQLDLRLRDPKQVSMDFTVGPLPTAPPTERVMARLPFNPQPQLDYQSIEIPKLLTAGNRLSPELLSYFPRSQTGGTMLDLGCGNQDFREICRHTGMDYVGIDYCGAGAMMLADAHGLPFKDESFDFVVSFAVLEHLRNPHVCMKELLRVMKPGAVFLGTLAFLEPYHLYSYYHPSPLGTHELLSAAGLEVIGIEANRDWQVLRAVSRLSLFPRAPWLFTEALTLPVQLWHRLWWKLGNLVDPKPETSEHARVVINAGGFRFVARKP